MAAILNKSLNKKENGSEQSDLFYVAGRLPCYSTIAALSFFNAFFSMRDTSRRGYCKRFTIRNCLQFMKAGFDDDLFVSGQLIRSMRLTSNSWSI